MRFMQLPDFWHQNSDGCTLTREDAASGFVSDLEYTPQAQDPNPTGGGKIGLAEIAS